MVLYQHLLAFLWALFVCVFAIPSIVRVAHEKKLLDEPNLRTVHANSTPRLGGLAIFAGFISSLTLFGSIGRGVKEMVAGAIIIFFIGLKDDIISVSVFKKVFAQLLAAGIIIVAGDVRITSFYGIFGVYDISIGFSYFISGFIVIGVTNAINLVDGLDGLAGSVVVLICAFLGVGFLYWGSSAYLPYVTVAFSLVGGVFGFLRYNFRNAIVFMGDTGSLVCGFIISVLAIKFVEMKPFENSSLFVMAVLFIPISDTLRVFLLRVLERRSPFSPDKNHLHHRLVDLGLNSVSTVFVLLLLNLLAVGIVWLFNDYSINMLFLLLIIYTIAVLGILEFLYRRKSDKISNFA
jgi:UDP-GlcNAc:undecaprenyl-phosphate GlcNAc-1-phosphate transferase